MINAYHTRGGRYGLIKVIFCFSEQGDYLALDLGGTNFRVLLVRLANGKSESVSKNYNVPTSKLHGPASEVSFNKAKNSAQIYNSTSVLIHVHGVVGTFRPAVY